MRCVPFTMRCKTGECVDVGGTPMMVYEKNGEQFLRNLRFNEWLALYSSTAWSLIKYKWRGWFS